MKWKKHENRIIKILKHRINPLIPIESLIIRMLWKRIMSPLETIKELQKGASITRFGDGEYQLALYDECGWCPYQENSPRLQSRLMEILKSKPEKNLLIGIVGMNKVPENVPEIVKKDRRMFLDFHHLRFWYLVPMLLRRKKYANAMISRPYGMMNIPLSEYKKIWDKRNVIFITPEQIPLEYENPIFFNNVKTTQLITDIPTKNAFDKYDQILAQAKEIGKKTENPLFIVSFGPAATVLAYDLFHSGFQALDLGSLTASYRVVTGEIDRPEAFYQDKK